MVDMRSEVYCHILRKASAECLTDFSRVVEISFIVDVVVDRISREPDVVGSYIN